MAFLDARIRSIGEADWEGVDRVQRAAFAAEAVEDIATIQHLAGLSSETCRVAEKDGEIVGYLIAHPWIADDLPPLNTMLPGLPEGAATFFLHDLALHPKARRQGVAQALLAAGFAAAQGLGLRDASLISIQNSSGFWQRMGFQPRADLADRVRPVLELFLKTDFVFMTRPDLEFIRIHGSGPSR